jgi:hypothetical protein
MLEIIEKELTEQGVFSGNLPPVLTSVTKAISAPYLPERMKMTVAISEIILYAGHFRRSIQLWNEAIIPVNAFAFSLASSGAGKDRAASEARKCFRTGYNILEEKRKAIQKKAAIDAAIKDGVSEDPNQFEVYKPYLQPLPPLFTAVTNSAAFLSHLADLEKSGIGAGFIYSGELGSELQTNPDMVTSIKDISEIYDEGGKESKPLKDKTNQTDAIKSMPVSALFVGSHDNILFDESVKRKFKLEFSTKLARRSFFNYSPEEVPRPQFPTMREMVEHKIRLEDNALQMRSMTDAAITDVTNYQVSRIGQPIKVSREVREIFEAYLEYNDLKSERISRLYPISKLVRKHLQWKALKMAGAIAFYNKHEEITKEDYIHSISFVELLDKDMEAFERELVKEPYELFVSYMHSIARENKAYIGLHQLRKMGYIPTTGKPDQRIKELINLASSYDESGIYTPEKDGILFEEIVKTNATGLSYKKVDNSQVESIIASGGTKDQVKEAKARVAQSAVDGFTFAEMEFKALGQMLEGDWAYSPFGFKDGIRGKDNLQGGCKWVCLDIDNSNITDEECHMILRNFNHHIARTSDKTNPFKFRILLELDSVVDVPDKVWKAFIRSIADYLSLDADLVPKSQIFFSYKGRNILSEINAEPLNVKEHLLIAHSESANKIEPTTIPNKEKSRMLSDKLNTFDYAFEAERGGRSIALIRAAKHARDLGMPKEEILALMEEINDYWVDPLDSQSFQTTILNQIARW